MSDFMLFRPVALAAAALAILGLGQSASAATPVPFRGQADLVITSFVPSDTSIQITTYATGRATHLGRFTRTETVTVKLIDLSLTGTLVFTAANGDQLNADVAGHFTSPNLDSAVGTYRFTGGTGRFHNASGGAEFTARPDEGVFDVTFKGTIQYSASQR